MAEIEEIAGKNMIPVSRVPEISRYGSKLKKSPLGDFFFNLKLFDTARGTHKKIAKQAVF